MNYIKEKSSKNLRLNHDEERTKKTIYSCRDPIRCNQLLQTCPKEMVGPHPPQRCPGQCQQPFILKELISTHNMFRGYQFFSCSQSDQQEQILEQHSYHSH